LVTAGAQQPPSHIPVERFRTAYLSSAVAVMSQQDHDFAR
jgi:hypothetical protein